LAVLLILPLVQFLDKSGDKGGDKSRTSAGLGDPNQSTPAYSAGRRGGVMSDTCPFFDLACRVWCWLLPLSRFRS
jgi:hypothetical protein